MTHRRVRHLETRTLGWTAVLALVAGIASAQSEPPDSGITPLGMAHGSPAGSYALSDFDNINLFSGALSIHLPLLKIGGRGESGMTVYLTIEQHWGVKQNKDFQPKFFPRFNWFRGLKPGYGPGTMKVYRDIDDLLNTLTRMTFTAGDQTQYEFRDVATDGALGGAGGLNRGTDFWTRDGSAATFVSDAPITDSSPLTAPSGLLHWRDGTTYRLDGGLVAWIRDRNGNTTTFAYEPTPHDATIGPQVKVIADSLGREVTFTYDTVGAQDIINFSGFGGAARSIVVHYSLLHSRTTGSPLPTGCTAAPCSYTQLFPELLWGFPFSPGGPQALFDPLVVSDVVLPNNQTYTLTYNVYGEVAGVTLPTGGSFGYSYQAGSPTLPPDGAIGGTGIYRRLAQKTVNDGTGVVMTTNYGQESDNLDPFFNSSAQSITVEHFDPSSGNSLIARDVHYFFGRGFSTLVAGPTDYPVWRHAKEYKTEFRSPADAILRTVTHDWRQKASWAPNPSVDEPAVDPRILTTTTTLSEVVPNRVSLQHFAYDTYNNRNAVAELDFGQAALINFTDCGTAATFLRCRETIPFTNYAANTAVHISDLPAEERVFEIVGGFPALKARTTYEYHNYTATANHAALVARPGIPHLDANFTTGYTSRGNATAVNRCKDVPNCATTATSYHQFDVAGNVVKRIDGRGFATTIAYDDNFGAPDGSVNDATSFSTFAFPTQVVNALSHATRTQFDFSTGQAVDQQDPNSVVSTATYGEGDPLDRLTTVIRANGDTASQTKTRFVYDNANSLIQTFRDKATFGDQLEREDLVYDGLGRESKLRSYETATAFIEVRTLSDALGRVKQKSNPFRPASETVAYTTTAYDALGRVKTVTTPDTAAVQTTYANNQTTVTDPASKVRQMTSDALGRLTQVVEDPAGRNYATTYTYNAFDQVTLVTQGSQTRTFAYDPLQRLTSATNPESGQTTYPSYDDNGNLLQKRDARALGGGTAGITYSYDPINRLSTKTYAFTAGVAATPNVTYTYDDASVPQSKGRLTRVSSSASTSDILAYDALGRVTSSRQTTSGRTYGFSYSYDRAGNLFTETYPSGRVATTTYDILNRVGGVSDASQTYADTFGYASHGAVIQMRLGNLRWEKATFNTRLQPTLIGLGSTQGATDLLSLGYGYGTTNNNGNVLSQTITVPGGTFTQGYGYDGVNRLQTASETPSAGTAWSQNYDHDRFGNHWVTVSNGFTLSSLTPTSATSFNASTNRLSASGYDLAGNQILDAQSRTFTYDGENRQATGPGGASYVYDGEGRRVSRTVGGVTTFFAYDALGRLSAEYATSGAATAGINFITQDHLGSTRLVTNSAGTVIGRHDFLPFGEEIPSALGNRSGITGYNATDAVRHKYSQKERDPESGLDFFRARYDSGPQGRFTSSDPGIAWRATIEDPQGWNRYNFVKDNPLRYVDLNGKDPLPANLRQFFDALFLGNFSRVDVQTDRSAQIVTNIADAEGVTLGRRIFLSRDGSAEYLERTLSGIALVGHELQHVQQYEATSVKDFLTFYLAEYTGNRLTGQSKYDAYRNITAEILARSAEAEVVAFLLKNKGIYKKLQKGEDLTKSDIGRIFSWNRRHRRGLSSDEQELVRQYDPLLDIYRP